MEPPIFDLQEKASFFGEIVKGAAMSAVTPGGMDVLSKARLEVLRAQVSRYLFRAWNNTPMPGSRVSGGYAGLNTPDAITPVAFRKDGQNDAPNSVYGLTKEACGAMASAHVRGMARPLTAFSSWGASLPFVLKFAQSFVPFGSRLSPEATKHIHISVIDTRELWESNQVFHVPSLRFLDPTIHPFHEEFLTYGVVQGRWHKAVPLQTFLDAGFDSKPLTFGLEVTPDLMGRARTVAHAFGEDFALPVYLAMLSSVVLQPATDRATLESILRGIGRVDIPQKWAADTKVRPNKLCREVGPFNNLMQALVKGFKNNHAFAFHDVDDHHEEKELSNKKRARDDEESDDDASTNQKRVRIEANTNHTAKSKKRTFDDDDDLDMDVDVDDYYIFPTSDAESDLESESEPEPAPKKAKYTTTTTTTTTAAAPKKLKPILKKSTGTYASAGVTTRRMSKAGKPVFKGPGVSTRRASVAMDGELKKLKIDMKD